LTIGGTADDDVHVGMFDWYEPIPAPACPVCGDVPAEWQGKNADCLLFVWRQGVAEPVEWRVAEESRTDGTQNDARLPASFSINARDSTGHSLLAHAEAPQGIWTATRIVAVVQSGRSREGRPFARVLWGEAPWLTKRDRDR
jgi:hypothetical protein